MYRIRGLKSSMDKIAYPSGTVTSLGSIESEVGSYAPSSQLGGYNNSYLFTRGNADVNPHPWSLESGLYIQGIRSDNSANDSKSISVQTRFSNDGSILPIDTTDRKLYNSYYSWSIFNTQGFKLLRNQVTYTPTTEVLVVQSNIKVNSILPEQSFGIRVTPTFLEDGVTNNIMPVTYRYDNAQHQPYTISYMNNYDNLSCSLLNANKESLAGWTASDWQINGDSNLHYYSTTTGFSTSSMDVGFRSTKILEVIDNVQYIRIGNNARVYGLVTVDVTPELRAAIKKAAGLHSFVGFRILIASGKGVMENETLTPMTINQLLRSPVGHGSELLPEESIVDPAGQYVILKFNRLTRVDVTFDNVDLAANVYTNENNEIRVNRIGKRFTEGGVLRVTQKHTFKKTDVNKTFTLNIPDTIPPDTPTFTEATIDSISGTGTIGDRVYAEYMGEVIGSATVTATGTFEISVNIVLMDDMEITLYTMDAAENKSTEVVIVLADLREPQRLDVAFNGDLIFNAGD